MDDKTHILKQLSKAVADGKTVNWDKLKCEHTEFSGIISQLENLKKINTLFSKNLPNASKRNNTAAPEPLFRWGHLKIIEPIGEGSFGQVFKAYDAILERQVALKLLKNKRAGSFYNNAFIQEARHMARIRQRNVLAIHGAAIHNNRVGMWTELIKGQTLAEIQSENTSFTSATLVQIASDMLKALTAIHSASLIHGDIKPSNIMRDHEGQHILMDFGSGLEQNDIIKNQGLITGTPMFLAPELFFDCSKSDKSDIYALGVLLFKLASGQYPLKVDNIIDLKQAHQTKKYQCLKQLAPELTKPMCQFIQYLLITNHHKRPNTALALKQLNDIIEAPQRRYKKLMRFTVIGTLLLGTVFSSIGFYQANLAKNAALEAQHKSEQTNQFLTNMLASPFDFGNGKDMRVIDILDYSAGSAAVDFQQQPEVLGSIYKSIGLSYDAIKQYDQASSYLQKSLSLSKKSPDHIDTLKIKISLAEIAAEQGKYEESTDMLHNILSLVKNSPDDMPDIIRITKIRLAENNQSQQNNTIALELIQPYLTHPDSPQSAINNHSFLALMLAAQIHLEQAQYPLAEQFSAQALVWVKQWSSRKKRPYISNHIVARNTLAQALLFQGKKEMVTPLYRNNLKQAEQVYGTDSVGYLSPLINLGTFLSEQNQLEEAEKYLQQAHKLCQKLFEKTSLTSITTALNLANLLVKKNQWRAGEHLIRQTLENAQQGLGAEHQLTLILEYNLAELLNNTKRYHEAEKLAKKNHLSMQQVMGENHPYTALALNNKAISLSGQQQFERALILHKQSIEILENSVGNDNPFTLTALLHYAQTLSLAGQAQQALTILTQLIEKQKRVLGTDHADTKKSIELSENLITFNT